MGIELWWLRGFLDLESSGICHPTPVGLCCVKASGILAMAGLLRCHWAVSWVRDAFRAVGGGAW